MSLLEELAQRGLTQDDLEKAASARLFAADAAAEGIDITSLQPEQVDFLYGKWTELQGGGAPEEELKVASAPVEATKEAEAIKVAARQEAMAKCAEAEYIGRYMARCFLDEMNQATKEAELPKEAKSIFGPSMSPSTKGTILNKTVNDNTVVDLASRAKKAVGFLKGNKKPAAAVAAGGVTGVAIGEAHGRSGHKKAASDGAFDELVGTKVLEILHHNNIDTSFLDKEAEAEVEPAAEPQIDVEELAYMAAVELLQQRGFTFQE